MGLKQRVRLLVAGGYLAALVGIYLWLGSAWDGRNDLLYYLGWLSVSGGLVIIMGQYLTEPYFSTPANSLVNGITIFITVWIGDVMRPVAGRGLLIAYSMVIVAASMGAMFSTGSTLGTHLYRISRSCGRSTVCFTALYWVAVYSVAELGASTLQSAVLVCYIVSLVWAKPLDVLALWLTSGRASRRAAVAIGEVIGCSNPSLYLVEMPDRRAADRTPELLVLNLKGKRHLALVIEIMTKLGRSWLRVVNLDISTDVVAAPGVNSAAFVRLEELPDREKQLVATHELYVNRSALVGFVSGKSDLRALYVELLSNPPFGVPELKQGTILRTLVYGNQTLYQITNAINSEERLEDHDGIGYQTAVAASVGSVSEDAISPAKWVPEPFTPVFVHRSEAAATIDKSKIIGTLPSTTLSVPVRSYPDLVTHNTAILGVLGIGKSCLAYELIAKVALEGIRVICIDITDEYRHAEKGLPYLLDQRVIGEIDPAILTAVSGRINATALAAGDGGNVNQFRQLLSSDIRDFLTEQAQPCNTGTMVKIIRPGQLEISYQTSDRKSYKEGDQWRDFAPLALLSATQLTQIVAEETLSACQAQGITTAGEARALLVFEEAHSLIPEWNMAGTNVDERACNATARVILQGRKYGLGCLVIAQRTANVAKSILNQCNTIFALRTFDETGIKFLANYFGEEYANALPKLEERHAVVYGRAVDLKQPIMIALNDRAAVKGILQNGERDTERPA